MHTVSMIQNAIQTDKDVNKAEDTKKGFERKGAANALARKVNLNDKRK